MTTPTRPDPALARAAASAELVFEGEVVTVGPPPGAWSGRYATFQSVTYRVVRLIADRGGRLAGAREVTVEHPIVANAPTVDTTPQLRPSLVAPGATVIVLARWADTKWTAIDEHHGVVPADDAHRTAIGGS